MQHATELIPSLWLGNSAMTADFYTKKEISIAINCGKQEFVNIQIVKKRVQNIDKFARPVFRASIIYLSLLLLFMVIDKR